MENQVILVIVLLLAIIVLTVVSTKLGISSPVFLVMAGLGISLIPGLPAVHFRPGMLFFILLPPLLYRAAWNTHLKEFFANRRPIGLHGIGLVIVTTGGIGLLAHALIPNFSLSMGFLLGSIVAPPDALAATSILQKLSIPKRVVTILEGESLVNDATSLILFRFALVAVLSGEFSLEQIGFEFIESSLLGIGLGCGIGSIFYLIHRFMPTNSNMNTILSIVTPYLMYLTAEQVEASGVLAVVSGGFFLAYHSSKLFSPLDRLQMLGVWETLEFVLNGLAFILVGLQLVHIVRHLHPDGISFPFAIGVGLAISLALIVIRLAWFFPATYLPRWLWPRLRTQDPSPGKPIVFLMGWCGMRGIVTLASVLSIPRTLADQTPFPFRALMIFVGFSVIVFTLVVQGLTLPYLIRRLGITGSTNETPQAQQLSAQLAKRVLNHILDKYPKEAVTLPLFIRQREKYERLSRAPVDIASETGLLTTELIALEQYRQLKQEIIAIQRDELVRFRNLDLYSDGLLRLKEFELDVKQMAID